MTMPSKPFRDWYAILEIQHDASPAEVKASYRRLALLHHPDKNIGSKAKDPSAAIRDVNDAWEVLKDEEQRRLYNKIHPESIAALQRAVLPGKSTLALWGVQIRSIGIIKNLSTKVPSVLIEQALKSNGLGKVRIVRGQGKIAAATLYFPSPAVLQRACNGKPIVIDKDTIGDRGWSFRVEPATFFNALGGSLRLKGKSPDELVACIFNIPSEIEFENVRKVLEGFGSIAMIRQHNPNQVSRVSHSLAFLLGRDRVTLT